MLEVLPKPSASAGVTKAQGKSSECEQGVSVTSGTISGCLGQEVPAEQPLAAGSPGFPTGGHLTEMHYSTPVEASVRWPRFSSEASPRCWCARWTPSTALCVPCSTKKKIESAPRRAKQWAALIAAPEKVTGQDFPSWASAAAQHIDPKLVQMWGAPAAWWCCFLKGRSSSSLVCCDGEALLWAQALHARRGAVTNNLNVDSCSFMSYTQWQISFEHPLHPYQATTGLALRPTEHPLSFLKCIFIKIPTFALGLLWMLMPSSLFLQNKLFVISQVLFFSERAICKWISFTFSLKCFCAGISKWKNFGKTIFWSASRKQKITWSYFELLLCIKWLKCLKLEFLKVLLTVEREKYIK